MELMSISLQFQEKRSYFEEVLKLMSRKASSMRLADRRNLEGNLSHGHALSASSAHSASRLSPSRLSASLVLSKNSLTRAKHENGAKHDVEVNEPFLSLE